MTDTLFWDTIPRALHYAKQKGMNSTLLNILNNPLLTNKIKHTRFYGNDQEKRMHDDFSKLLLEYREVTTSVEKLKVVSGKTHRQPKR